MLQSNTSRPFVQHLMDCAWDYGPGACNGGDYGSALEYLTAAGGGGFLNDDYSYKGDAAFCRHAACVRWSRLCAAVEGLLGRCSAVLRCTLC